MFQRYRQHLLLVALFVALSSVVISQKYPNLLGQAGGAACTDLGPSCTEDGEWCRCASSPIYIKENVELNGATRMKTSGDYLLCEYPNQEDIYMCAPGSFYWRTSYGSVTTARPASATYNENTQEWEYYYIYNNGKATPPLRYNTDPSFNYIGNSILIADIQRYVEKYKNWYAICPPSPEKLLCAVKDGTPYSHVDFNARCSSDNDCFHGNEISPISSKVLRCKEPYRIEDDGSVLYVQNASGEEASSGTTDPQGNSVCVHAYCGDGEVGLEEKGVNAKYVGGISGFTSADEGWNNNACDHWLGGTVQSGQNPNCGYYINPAVEVQGGEECDGSANCTNTCACAAGYLPDGYGNCVACGANDTSERCEGVDPEPLPVCSDGQDNDSDGRTDVNDFGCYACPTCAYEYFQMNNEMPSASDPESGYYYNPLKNSEDDPCEEELVSIFSRIFASLGLISFEDEPPCQKVECDEGEHIQGDECVECRDGNDEDCSNGAANACQKNVCKSDNTCGIEANPDICTQKCLECEVSSTDDRGYICAIDYQSTDDDYLAECRCRYDLVSCGEDNPKTEKEKGLGYDGKWQCCATTDYCSWSTIHEDDAIGSYWYCEGDTVEPSPPPDQPPTDCSGRIGCDKEICEGQVDFCYNGDQCTQPYCNLETGECEYIPWQVPIEGCETNDTGSTGGTSDEDDSTAVSMRFPDGSDSSAFSGIQGSANSSEGGSSDTTSSDMLSSVSSESMMHTVCRDNACVTVLEQGTNECESDIDCSNSNSSSSTVSTASSSSSNTSLLSSIGSSFNSDSMSSIDSSLSSSTSQLSSFNSDSISSDSFDSDTSSFGVSSMTSSSGFGMSDSIGTSSKSSTIIAFQSSAGMSLTLSIGYSSSLQNDDDNGDGDNDDGISDNDDSSDNDDTDDDGDGDNDDGIPDNQNSSQDARSSVSHSTYSQQRLVAAASLCGNGILESQEECDDSNRRDNDGCSSTCLLEIGICGDGIVQTLLGEQCESSTHSSSLPYTCQKCRFVSLYCGDGKLDAGEECDEGPLNSTSPNAECRPNCSISRCGDGVLDDTEVCDDGNRVQNDGCDRFCRIENGKTKTPTQVAAEYAQQQQVQFPGSYNSQQYQFPQYSNFQQLPYQLPLAQLQPLIQSQGPVGDTGPAAVVVAASGMAAGIGWMRRKRK